MRAPLFREVPGTPERPSGHRRDGGESSRNSSWLGGRSARNTAAVSVVLLLLLAAVGQFGTEREWNTGLREMVRARVESAGVASAVRRVQTLEEISDGMAHRGEGGMRSVAGGERTGRESAPPPPRVFDIKLRGEETEEEKGAGTFVVSGGANNKATNKKTIYVCTQIGWGDSSVCYACMCYSRW